MVLVVVGLLVVGGVFFALYGGMLFGTKRIAIASEELRATQIIAEKMETIRLYTWDQINTAGFIPATFSAKYYPLGQSGNQGFTYSGTITVSAGPSDVSYSNLLKTVSVGVVWTIGGITHHRTASTYVAQNGLQTYVY